jgi:hypothetical protein
VKDVEERCRGQDTEENDEKFGEGILCQSRTTELLDTEKVI